MQKLALSDCYLSLKCHVNGGLFPLSVLLSKVTSLSSGFYWRSTKTPCAEERGHQESATPPRRRQLSGNDWSYVRTGTEQCEWIIARVLFGVARCQNVRFCQSRRHAAPQSRRLAASEHGWLRCQCGACRDPFRVCLSAGIAPVCLPEPALSHPSLLKKIIR